MTLMTYSQHLNWHNIRGLSADQLLELLRKGAEAYIRRTTRGKVGGRKYRPNDLIPVAVDGTEGGNLRVSSGDYELHSQGYLTLGKDRGFKSVSGNWELVIRAAPAVKPADKPMDPSMSGLGITQSDRNAGVVHVDQPVRLPEMETKPGRSAVWPGYDALTLLRPQQGVGNGGYAPVH